METKKIYLLQKDHETGNLSGDIRKLHKKLSDDGYRLFVYEED